MRWPRLRRRGNAAVVSDGSTAPDGESAAALADREVAVSLGDEDVAVAIPAVGEAPTRPESGPGSVRSVVGRAALIILVATLASRLFGLIRDIATAGFFGSNSSTDAFFLAYKVPYLLVLMVGGALTATFVPT